MCVVSLFEHMLMSYFHSSFEVRCQLTFCSVKEPSCTGEVLQNEMRPMHHPRTLVGFPPGDSCLVLCVSIVTKDAMDPQCDMPRSRHDQQHCRSRLHA